MACNGITDASKAVFVVNWLTVAPHVVHVVVVRGRTPEHLSVFVYACALWNSFVKKRKMATWSIWISSLRLKTIWRGMRKQLTELFKPHYPNTNSPDWFSYISLKIELKQIDQNIFPLGHHFINSHGFFSWLCIGIVRRKLMLVTLGN